MGGGLLLNEEVTHSGLGVGSLRPVASLLWFSVLHVAFWSLFGLPWSPDAKKGISRKVRVHSPVTEGVASIPFRSELSKWRSSYAWTLLKLGPWWSLQSLPCEVLPEGPGNHPQMASLVHLPLHSIQKGQEGKQLQGREDGF